MKMMFPVSVNPQSKKKDAFLLSKVDKLRGL